MGKHTQRTGVQPTPVHSRSHLPSIDVEVPLLGANAGQTYPVTFPGHFIWSLYNTFQQIGLEQAFIILSTDQAIREDLKTGGAPNVESAVWSIWLHLGTILTGGTSEEGKPPAPDAVLGFTYQLLRSKTITHAKAAEIAGALLADKTITANAWRKKIARYAKRNNLPAVEQRKRVRKP